MGFMLLEKFAQINWDHGMKGKWWQNHSKTEQGRRTRCSGNSLSRACVCVVCFVSAVTLYFHLAFSSCRLKRLGKDLLAVSFPQSCLDSL